MIRLTNHHPAVADFVRSEEGWLLREDLLAWVKWQSINAWYSDGAPPIEELEFHLDKPFVSLPEFRSLFDYRVKARPEFRNLLPDLLRATDLYIATPTIGPRFRIQHGHGTYIFAKEIGSDFWVNHLVTVGSNGGIPSIGDRVTIRTGAVVVGPITVGDDALITANAVLHTDMPANHVAYAPRTVISAR
jgi:acetyltransferase-like isoleucine patch superfamily enzyme